ncbi:Putative long-chain fatty acid transport protein [Moritella viscosa]|uniref:Putative long-chain fatty acid transport protein n=1 Tax=Moritella viscosa TaxID=80854 RepID=A0A090ICT6_9GAMM|nr:outer membrane protein transport protein [Moritella viscosa]CED58412.1 outer membrane protein transport protein [Moritella viscosa]SGY81810.1 Putative long-chain fatty acid transport protein [Moritella viscosa]SGY81863.1 Putative long-chain fatty acid transport protein [Moritella viscosa]SHN96124.1 Putative long-chain fatty acid transport protein [Moritella viscosa]SHN96227.1 Putative long-chain fatty acid transport protein [Moritella viscosa]
MRINKVALAVTALLAASQVNAAGFQVSEHSASGLGRAFAGEAAIGDDAASLARNPALMATFDKAQLSVAASYVSPDVDIEGQSNLGPLPKEYFDAEDIAPSQIVPAMYYIQPINDKFAAGLAIYSNYGTGTEYSNDYMAGPSAGKTSIMSVNFNPNISYRVNEQLSLGAGVSVVYATAELERNIGALGVINGLKPSVNAAKMEGDGYGFGWNLGALYEVNENNRFGISYKSKVKTELKGEYTGTASSGNAHLMGVTRPVDGTLDINLPSILEVSGYHKLTDKFAVSYSWQYSTWSDFGDIIAESAGCDSTASGGSKGVCLEKKEDYKDSSRYAIGGEYYLSEAVTLRAGYAFDEQAGEATLSIPDTDRQWYTAGLTYKATKALSFDLAAALVAGKKITFDERLAEADPASTITLTSSGDAWIYSAQMNYSF